MNLWPTITTEIEGTLFLIDEIDYKIILIIEQVFGEQTILYKAEDIAEKMEQWGISFSDVFQAEKDCLDPERKIFKVFFEA